MARGSTENIPVSQIGSAIADLLKEYGDVCYEAAENGLDAAEAVLIASLRDASPDKSGKFKRAWKSKEGRKYKLQRYVHNTTMVKGKEGKIPLSNILEYSTIRGKPFIARTYEQSMNAMAAAMAAELKKEV